MPLHNSKDIASSHQHTYYSRTYRETLVAQKRVVVLFVNITTTNGYQYKYYHYCYYYHYLQVLVNLSSHNFFKQNVCHDDDDDDDDESTTGQINEASLY